MSPQAGLDGYPARTVALDVNLRTPGDMEVVGSFETTFTPPLPDRSWPPLFNADLTRWLDQRRLAPPRVSEEGTWLCETDAASQETTALVLLDREKTDFEVLGYVGEDSVLFASGSFGVASVPRTLSVWERASGESRELIELDATHAQTNVRIALIGGAALE